ncbi:MAG: hypothetical protein ACXW2V_05010 [Candidatus Aminicenantales bacterium]
MKLSRAAALAALILFTGLACGRHDPERARESPAAKAGPGPGLWQKAVEIYRANCDWHPEKAAIVSEVRNGRNKFLSLTEMFLTLRPGGPARLDRSLRNGVDTTAKTRSKAKFRHLLEGIADGEDNPFAISMSDSPFDPDRQAAVSVTPREGTKVLRDRSCCLFDFRFSPGVKKGRPRVTWLGQAWLEDQSGRPVELAFSISPLPGKIRSARVVYRYEAEPGPFVVKDVAISGTGGFLFIKRYFNVTTTFSQHRRAPSAPDKR